MINFDEYTKLFTRCRKWNISLVFISQPYFKFQKMLEIIAHTFLL